ncbi:Tannase/feruloyl esterase [Dendryphion nanum]|uniref:Carboxylic ester hydrolase n=1 Tax=Dendryphion nanum TaxID=256645 RepID=A0A9P9DUT6_9PLEO|nr:Tannase/feruloyl esterase [Dendryphion nanum]
MANLSLFNTCVPSALPFPTIFGAEFLSIQASLTQNYTAVAPWVQNPGHWNISRSNVSFCNVTLTHTHPGQSDLITTQIWLPVNPPWNKRLKAVGGGGWVAGLSAESVAPANGAIAEGYAVVATDAGGVRNNADVGDWALKSPGNVDINALQNFASVGLKDAALAAKSIIKSFFGEAAKFSYFSGCSQGGRQGYMFAQRYPDIFDGIAAAAPAIYYGASFMSTVYPRQVMHEQKYYPSPCELDAIRNAAIEACDGLDGLIDGIISRPDSCKFDPYSMVNKTLNCSSSSPGPKTISKGAAAVAEAAWYGVKDAKGEFLWYTMGHQPLLSGVMSTVGPVCSNGTCSVSPIPVWTDWIRYFLHKNKDVQYGSNVTRRQFEGLLKQGVREYGSIIGTDWADLKDFREAGGKLITYHGTGDSGIPYLNTRHYFNAVKALDHKVTDFYRLFEAPGLGHCGFGIGGYPGGTFDALVKWVEEGVAPEKLETVSQFTNKTSIVCPYPKKASFKGKKDAVDFGAKDFVCA